MRHVLILGWPILLAVSVFSVFLVCEQMFMFWMLHKHNVAMMQQNVRSRNPLLKLFQDDDDNLTDDDGLLDSIVGTKKLREKINLPSTYDRVDLPRLILPPPRNETAVICMIAKEEEAYIEEWTDYHLGIGFDSIFVYDNSDIPEGGILQQWGKERHEYYGDPVFVKHYPGKSMQYSAYEDCANHAIELNHTWIAFIDGDEFIVIKDRQKYPHIVDMLQEYVPSGELTVWWRIFGSSNRMTYEPIPVTKRFQYRVEDNYRMNHQFKSIARAADLDLKNQPISSPHHFPYKKGTQLRSTDGKFPVQTTDGYVGPDDVVVIHHYNTKSYGELMRKRLRGSAKDGFQKWLETAKQGQMQNGDPIPNGTIFDNTAWQVLKEVAPKYGVYDTFYDHDRATLHQKN